MEREKSKRTPRYSSLETRRETSSGEKTNTDNRLFLEYLSYNICIQARERNELLRSLF